MSDTKTLAESIQKYARCTSKTAYDTELKARRAARFQRREHGEQLVPYRCTEPGCTCWHLRKKTDT